MIFRCYYKELLKIKYISYRVFVKKEWLWIYLRHEGTMAGESTLLEPSPRNRGSIVAHEYTLLREDDVAMSANNNQTIATTPCAMRVLVCEPHLNKIALTHYVGDAAIGATEGIAAADIVVFLVAHKRFAVLDATVLQGKRVLDFCGILHKNRPATDEQEHLFWPASKGQESEQVQQKEAYRSTQHIQ